MEWIDTMPDEAFKALIITGLLLALMSSLLLRSFGPGRPRVRTTLHTLICIAGLSFGVGCLIGAVRESDTLSHGATVVFAVGVLLTTITYTVFIVRHSPKSRVVAITVAVCTLASAAVLGASENSEDCGACGNPTTTVATTTPHS